jgi:hypothetical protein
MPVTTTRLEFFILTGLVSSDLAAPPFAFLFGMRHYVSRFDVKTGASVRYLVKSGLGLVKLLDRVPAARCARNRSKVAIEQLSSPYRWSTNCFTVDQSFLGLSRSLL